MEDAYERLHQVLTSNTSSALRMAWQPPGEGDARHDASSAET